MGSDDVPWPSAQVSHLSLKTPEPSATVERRNRVLLQHLTLGTKEQPRNHPAGATNQ